MLKKRYATIIVIVVVMIIIFISLFFPKYEFVVSSDSAWKLYKFNVYKSGLIITIGGYEQPVTQKEFSKLSDEEKEELSNNKFKYFKVGLINKISCGWLSRQELLKLNDIYNESKSDIKMNLMRGATTSPGQEYWHSVFKYGDDYGSCSFQCDYAIDGTMTKMQEFSDIVIANVPMDFVIDEFGNKAPISIENKHISNIIYENRTLAGPEFTDRVIERIWPVRNSSSLYFKTDVLQWILWDLFKPAREQGEYYHRY